MFVKEHSHLFLKSSYLLKPETYLYAYDFDSSDRRQGS